MVYRTLLHRYGRIFKPRYKIILYHNYRPVVELGVVYPFKEINIKELPETTKVKVVKLHIDRINFWLERGVVFPHWLLSIRTKLHKPATFMPVSIPQSKELHSWLVSGKAIYLGESWKPYSSNYNKVPKEYRFFRGKYLMRHWLRLRYSKTRDSSC